MNQTIKLKQIILVAGDLATAYISLSLALYLRYGGESFYQALELHWQPFTIIFFVWLIVFYIGGLYDWRSLKNDFNFLKHWSALLVIVFLLTVAVFYFTAGLIIEPKTNFLLLAIIFTLLNYLWRTAYNNILAVGVPLYKILIIGDNAAVQELTTHLNQNPQLGYEIKGWFKNGADHKELEQLAQIIIAEKINLVIVPAHIKRDSRMGRLIYQNLAWGAEIIDLAEFYEKIFHKISLTELEESSFLGKLSDERRFYEVSRNALEQLLAIPLIILFSPLALMVALAIIFTSHGPLIIKQKRVGRHSQEFTIYKFRTMVADAEKNGPRWAVPNDNRLTPVGKFIRRTHLDELPQLINLLLGDISLVGPRPERPEFVTQLREAIPYYNLRHLMKPGITGWAQINYRYGSSVADAREKLQFEIYYLRNRSWAMDFIILIKTIRHFFVTLN